MLNDENMELRGRASDDDTIGCRIESYFSFQPVLQNRYNKGRSIYYPIWGIVNIEKSERVVHKITPAGFLSHYLNGFLPYVRRQITVNKMCWVRR